VTSYRHRFAGAVGLVVVVCAGVRLAYWLITPLWPLLAVLGCLTAIGMVVLRRQ